MRDRFGRDLHDLRISLTDRCNLRCVYCAPPGHAGARPRREPLRDDELLLVVRAAADLGVRKLRLTGGEPTLRPGLVDLVRALAAIPGLDDIGMTTNGLLLEPMASALAAAGLHRVNISLDTTDPEKFRRITGGGRLERVLAGIAAAEAARLVPIKLNTVVVRGFNDDDVVPLAALTRERPWEVRFIEIMPFGRLGRFAAASLVPSTETMARIEAALGRLIPLDVSGEHPARTYRLPDAAGRLGFISPWSQPFCSRCGRLRLTADGRLRLCLLHDDEVDLLTPLRRGAGYEELRALLRTAAFGRPAGHALADGAFPRARLMGEIGG